MGSRTSELLSLARLACIWIPLNSFVWALPMTLFTFFDMLTSPEELWMLAGGYWFFIIPGYLVGAVGSAVSVLATFACVLVAPRFHAASPWWAAVLAGLVTLLAVWIWFFVLTGSPAASIAAGLIGSSIMVGSCLALTSRWREDHLAQRFSTRLLLRGVVVSVALGACAALGGLVLGTLVSEAVFLLLPLIICTGVGISVAAALAQAYAIRRALPARLVRIATGAGAAVVGAAPLSLHLSSLADVPVWVTLLSSGAVLFVSFATLPLCKDGLQHPGTTTRNFDEIPTQHG